MIVFLPRQDGGHAAHIHVPRTGGNSVRQWLRFIPGARVVQPKNPERLDWHFPAYLARVRPEIPTMAFVRNPWDWHVSLFRILHPKIDPSDVDAFRTWLHAEAPKLRFGSAYSMAVMLAEPSTGDVLVNTVLRYEDGLESGVRQWLEEQGIAAPSQPFQTRHASDRIPDFRPYYPKPEDVDLVSTLCAWEIDHFHYRFEEES